MGLQLYESRCCSLAMPIHVNVQHVQRPCRSVFRPRHFFVQDFDFGLTVMSLFAALSTLKDLTPPNSGRTACNRGTLG